MAEAPGSGRRSLYKATGSPSWKEAFRQGGGCLERMRNSRDRLLNRYRQAGGGVPGSAQSTLLVHEVMEEAWSALRSVKGRPEASAQLEEPVDLAVLEEIQQELADQGVPWGHPSACSSLFGRGLWFADPLRCSLDRESNLRVASGVVTCPCGLYLSNHFPELTEQRLRACIEDSVNAHSAHCAHTPEFSVTQATGERPTLLMSCLACDTWTAIL
uniref:RPA interacting protein n=1 Tax=Panthera tigris altaica TaxID=74533 RepID=A0A8C9KC21_PANTA